MICHRNISPQLALTVYILVDPGSNNRPQMVVEAEGKVMNNVLSGQQGGFRLGIQFTKFARDGRQRLLNHLPADLVQSAKLVTAADAVPVADSTTVADNSAPPPDEARAVLI